MNLSDTAGIILFHRARAQHFGNDTAQALGWTSAETQQARFEALAGIGNMQGKEVLDIGCGHGDLLALIRTKYGQLKYTGIDHAPAFIKIATERYGSIADTNFLLADFWSAPLPETDYVLASGALSYRHSDAEFVYKMIAKMFATCQLGLAFNLLSNTEREDGVLVAYNPQEILAYCKTLATRAELIEGYLTNDFTLYLYR
jgi:SAM-dependent methyltransferase